MSDHMEDKSKKAINMLEQCESVQLSSIDDSGYPRICENEDSSPKYCILKFKAHKAVFFIDGEKTIVNITDSGKV